MKDPDREYIDITDKDGNVIGYELASTPGLQDYHFQFTNQMFRNLFTLSEKAQIRSSTDALVQVLQDELVSSNTINLRNQDIIDLITNLVTVGIVTAERKDEILSGGFDV